jgi:DNA-binding transcriptional LysR family regulator
MITQRRLQHLLALVEHAHFGRAANALDISQPALTKSLQALEAELGVALIDRKRGAVGPTVFGELVLHRSKRMLTEEDELRREIALLAGLETGSLKLALGPYPSVTSGYAAIARLLARHPKVGIAVHVAGWREIASRVLARTVELRTACPGRSGRQGRSIRPMAISCRPSRSTSRCNSAYCWLVVTR